MSDLPTSARISYDAQANAAYICLVPTIEPGACVGSTGLTDPSGNRIGNLDFDAAGQILGIEILGARHFLPGLEPPTD